MCICLYTHTDAHTCVHVCVYRLRQFADKRGGCHRAARHFYHAVGVLLRVCVFVAHSCVDTTANDVAVTAENVSAEVEDV